MAETSVSDFAFLINQQINSREELTVCLAKLHALVVLALENTLIGIQQTTFNEYLWVVNDYITQAIQHNDNGLDILLKHSRLNADCTNFSHCP